MNGTPYYASFDAAENRAFKDVLVRDLTSRLEEATLRSRADLVLIIKAKTTMRTDENFD